MTLVKGRTGIWEGDFRYEGFERLRLSMGTRKKAEAQPRHDAVVKLYRQNRRDLLAQLTLPKGHPQRLTVERLAQMVEHHEPLVPIPAPVVEPTPDETPATSRWGTVRAVGERWLQWLDAHPKRSRGTYQTRRAQLHRFCAFVYEGVAVGDRHLEDVTTAVWDAYQRHLVATAKPNTVTGYMTGVGALWRWAARQEDRAAREARRAPVPLYSPVDRDRQHTDQTSRERYLERAEADRLVAATPVSLLPAVSLALLAGLRLEEALYLRRVDVDLTLGLLTIAEKPLPDGTIWKPKTKRSTRRVPIGPTLKPILTAHLAQADGEASWWLTPRPANPEWPWHPRVFQQHFTPIVQRAELPAGRADPQGVTFHTLRHSFASWLVMEGVDLYTVAQLLGDTLATVERTYAHLSPDFKAAAVAKLAKVFQMPKLPGELPG